MFKMKKRNIVITPKHQPSRDQHCTNISQIALEMLGFKKKTDLSLKSPYNELGYFWERSWPGSCATTCHV